MNSSHGCKILWNFKGSEKNYIRKENRDALSTPVQTLNKMQTMFGKFLEENQ